MEPILRTARERDQDALAEMVERVRLLGVASPAVDCLTRGWARARGQRRRPALLAQRRSLKPNGQFPLDGGLGTMSPATSNAAKEAIQR